MTKWKSLLSILLAVTMVLSLAACGSTSTNETTDEAPAATSEATAPEAETATATAAADSAAVELPRSDRFHVADGSVTFKDQLDMEVTIPLNPKRIVLMDCNALDVWYQCGGTAVGRTSISHPEAREKNEYTDAINALTDLGRVYDPVNVEMLISLDPDLVMLTSNFRAEQDTMDALEAAGIAYCNWSLPEKFDDFIECLELFTILTGRDDLYQSLATENIVRRENVLKQVEGQTPVQIMLLCPSKGEVYSMPNDTYRGAILDDLHAENIGGKERGPLSPEALLDLDPQWLLSFSGSGREATEAALFEMPVWNELTAVKEGRYNYLPVDLFYLHPGVRYAEAYEYAAHLLYPDAFKN